MPPSPYVHQQTAPRQVCRFAAPHPSIGTVGSEHCSNTEEKNGERGHEEGPLGLAATQPQSFSLGHPLVTYLRVGVIVESSLGVIVVARCLIILVSRDIRNSCSEERQGC